MLVPARPSDQSANWLLSMLPPLDYQALLPQMELVQTAFKQVLYERGQQMTHVYFPCNAVFSVLIHTSDGSAVEIGTIGSEGFAGLGLFIGAGAEFATETTVCQFAGDTLRLPAEVFQEAIIGDTPLRRLAARYLSAYLGQVSQSAACNRLHSVEERLARWVLMTQARVASQEFQLTQDFLADMLGVHRPSISHAVGLLQRAGHLSYSRGKMTVLDYAGLEGAACECYRMIKSQFRRMFGVDSDSQPLHN